MFWNLFKAMMSNEQRQHLKAATDLLSQIESDPRSTPTSLLVMYANPDLVYRATPDDMTAITAEAWRTQVLTTILTELDRRFPVPDEGTTGPATPDPCPP